MTEPKKAYIPPEVPPDTPKEEKKEANPFGDGMKPAIYIIFDEKNNKFFPIAAPGFLEDPARAYFALKSAEKELDQLYFTKETARNRIITTMQNMASKAGFRRFLRGR